MARIYKSTDRKKITIDDVTVTLAPLNLENKSKAMSMLLEGQKKNDYLILNEAIYFTVRACLKNIEGVKDSNDEPYKLEFDEDNFLTKECLQDLTNMECTAKLLSVCGVLIADFTKDDYGIDGVSVVKK